MINAIEVENLSKLYQIGEFSTGTLSSDIERKWALFRGKEDPFLKIGEANVRANKGISNVVWSLRELNFAIPQGEAVGIIGKNGAGKSTLLKILSQITPPTTGQIRMRGRVSSLLEVGTGFHPELTGRENIYLNGAILGMSKREISKKLEEIIDFSGIERYIDTPVKRYSSGMYVRLAFAVAAHLESEILIVDEVLAVGDAEFQKKCLGKMGEITHSAGRTILFVSHNLSAIRKLCSQSILLQDGTLKRFDNSENVIREYYEPMRSSASTIDYNHIKTTFAQMLDIQVNSEIDEPTESIKTNHQIQLRFKLKSISESSRVGLTLILKDQEDNIVFSSINNQDPGSRRNRVVGDEFTYICTIPKNLLNDITYQVSLILFENNFMNASTFENVFQLKVEDSPDIRADFYGEFGGVLRPNLVWKTLGGHE